MMAVSYGSWLDSLMLMGLMGLVGVFILLLGLKSRNMLGALLLLILLGVWSYDMVLAKPGPFHPTLNPRFQTHRILDSNWAGTGGEIVLIAAVVVALIMMKQCRWRSRREENRRQEKPALGSEDLHRLSQSLSRMETRIENLETILLSRK